MNKRFMFLSALLLTGFVAFASDETKRENADRDNAHTVVELLAAHGSADEPTAEPTAEPAAEPADENVPTRPNFAEWVRQNPKIVGFGVAAGLISSAVIGVLSWVQLNLPTQASIGF